MAKKKLPPIETLAADTQQFFEILNDKSDFAVILIAAGYLDAAVAGLLAKAFCDEEIAVKLLESPTAALSGFGARVDLAYAIGLIRSVIRDDLLTVAKIRNRCAHNHLRLNFEDAAIRDLVGNLKYLAAMAGDSPPAFVAMANTPRSKFALTVTLISQRLIVDALGTKRIGVCQHG
jgi:DNA-binding MltR family transcriptional regulator